MMERPIPAFYCCYLLRSTRAHHSLYVGSTPNPRRRLKQHNGESLGGASRTARANLRPWEMVAVVSNFPTAISALQFEWAWQHAWKTRHISKNECVMKKRSLPDKLTHLRLLLASKSFERWPLEVRFFDRLVFQKWNELQEKSSARLRDGLKITLVNTDGSKQPRYAEAAESTKRTNGVPLSGDPNGVALDTLDLSYSSLKPVLEKSKALATQSVDHNCAVCNESVSFKEELSLLCPGRECDMVAHLGCLASRFISEEGTSDGFVPINGTCPSCHTNLTWVELLRELSLRTRGEPIVAKLLKEPRRRKGKDVPEALDPLALGTKPSTQQGLDEEFDGAGEDDLLEPDAHEEGFVYQEDPWEPIEDIEEDEWAVISDVAGDDPLPLPEKARTSAPAGSSAHLPLIIPNSDWDDIEDVSE